MRGSWCIPRIIQAWQNWVWWWHLPCFSASGKSRDAAGVGTTFEGHSLGDSVAEWPPATIQGDGFYSPWIWRYLELFAASVALCESHKLWLAVMHSEQRSCRGQQAAMCRSKRRLSKDIKGMIIVRVFRTSSSAKQEHACGKLREPQMQTRSCSLEAPYYGHRNNGLALLACLVALQIHERNSLMSKYLHIRFKLSSNMCVYKRPVLTMRFQALRFEYLLSDLHFC